MLTAELRANLSVLAKKLQGGVDKATARVDEIAAAMLPVLHNASEMTANLIHVTNALDQGRGSAGRFVNDPRLYESLLLTSTGRKSGRQRTCPLLYMRDGDNYVVVASYGGSPTHPAWWLNLQATPDATITIRDRDIAVRAREATKDEWERLWPQLVDGYPGYGRYQLATPRKIPVVILEPA